MDGYSLKNTKCFITVPGNRYRNVSLMLAIKHNRIVAKGTIEGAFNGDKLHLMTGGIICVPRLKEVFLVKNFIKLLILFLFYFTN
ncbi:hypothetical protein HZS_3399 [Henneguya salminicola]|nr:hypothetical protein HZS_3399 [Henneguya salminicola]